MSEPTPSVVEVPLRKDYPFMYEHFLISTQQHLYLLLEKTGTTVDALRFDFSAFKYGAPNDEARGGHPLSAHGLGFYGLYEVQNSPWLGDLMRANRVHPRHEDSLFSDRRHFVACFKDVMLEVACSDMKEVQLSVDEITGMVLKQLDYLDA